jgi:hypothetical protein
MDQVASRAVQLLTRSDQHAAIGGQSEGSLAGGHEADDNGLRWHALGAPERANGARQHRAPLTAADETVGRSGDGVQRDKYQVRQS